MGWVGVVGWAVRSPPSALPHRSPLEPRESLTNGRAAVVHHWYERWAYLRWTLGPEVPGRSPCSCSAGLCGWVGLPMDFIVTSRLRGIWQIRSRRMSSSQFLCELHQPANPAGFQTMCADGSLELRPMGWDTELRSRRATLGLSLCCHEKDHQEVPRVVSARCGLRAGSLRVGHNTGSLPCCSRRGSASRTTSCRLPL